MVVLCEVSVFCSLIVVLRGGMLNIMILFLEVFKIINLLGVINLSKYIYVDREFYVYYYMCVKY